jgi:uncharacterized protein
MVHKIAFILLVIGGLNWLLTAFGMNIVNMALGSMPMVEKAVYILVGLSAVYEIFTHKKHCTACSTSTSAGV